MQPFDALEPSRLSGLRGVLTDIDDTLTTHGRLTAEAYASLELLHDAGVRVIPITGRPAGWCDHIARMWPVSAVVGENGAFYFYYDCKRRRLVKRYDDALADREGARLRLDAVRDAVLAEFPGAGIASDQDYRAADLAIDFCEDVAPLPPDAIARIVAIAESHGATAKVSSIHVNIWYGTFDKLSMTRRLCRELFGEGDDELREGYLFVGDSPNDAPMFEFFPLSVGVANITAFSDRITTLPNYVTAGACGAGFAELARRVASNRQPRSVP